MGRRPKQTEIPMEGPGVAPVKDRKLDKLCDDFLDLLDKRSNLSEKLTAIESQILDRMGELKVPVHRFRDQEARIAPGRPHVKIRTIKDGDAASSDGEDEAGE